MKKTVYLLLCLMLLLTGCGPSKVVPDKKMVLSQENTMDGQVFTSKVVIKYDSDTKKVASGKFSVKYENMAKTETNGNILTGLKYGKKIIAVPRLAQFGEHTNDHQTQIVNRFALEGYLLKCDLDDDFEEILKKVRNFKPKKYKFNNVHFCKCLKEEIEKL